MTTRSKKQLVMDHILQNVFDLAVNSPLQKALNHEGYAKPEDFLMEKDETLDALAMKTVMASWSSYCKKMLIC